MPLDKPKVMGILNVTPDSFYTGSRVSGAALLGHAEKMLKEGASFLDIGGYSTRPGAPDISEEEECRRVLPAVQQVARQFPEAVISVDTYRSNVARAAVQEGAMMINDGSGGTLDSAMFETVAKLKVPYVLMHMQGTPQTMTSLTNYNNLVKDMMDYFNQRLAILSALDVKDVVLDPGFGFAKTSEQNFSLLTHLDHFKIAGKPILVGISRKSMIWKTLQTTAEHALNGTTSLNTIALLNGADILRVHDVKEATEAVELVTALRHSA